VLATISTCGKSFGLAGAFVTGPRQLIDHVINYSRPFIYSTAALPVLAEGISAALDVMADEPWRRQRVLENAHRLRQELESRGIPTNSENSPIVPVLVRDNHRSVKIATEVQKKGYDIRALRPPTVPEGTARLRISVQAEHSETEIVGLCDVMAQAFDRIPEVVSK